MRAEEELNQARDQEAQLGQLGAALEAQLNADRTAHTAGLENARAKARELENEIGFLKESESNAIRASEAAARTTARCAELETQLSEQQKEHRADDERLRQLQLQVEDLTQQLEQALRDLEDSRAQLQLAQQSHRKQIDETVNRVDQLQSELAYHKTVADETKKELDHARDAREKIFMELASEKQRSSLRTSQGLR